MSNMPIDRNERKAGPACPVSKPSHAHIIICKPFRITGKTEKDNPGQLHLLLQQFAALQKSLLLFAIAAQFTQPGHNKHLTCLSLDGATLQFMRSWYSGEHEKLLLRQY
jgi:hypothetical protein